MRPAPTPNRPHIVVAGGGFGGLETVLHLRRRLDKAADITLVSSSDRFVFRPYLTYVPFGLVPDRVEIDLRTFARIHNVEFLQGRVLTDGPQTRALDVGGRSLSFDHLVIATGSMMLRPDVPGLSDYGLVVGDTGDLLRLRGRLLDLLEPPSRSVRRIVLVAAPGSAWTGPLYEVAFMLETWLRWKGLRDGVSITVATSDPVFGQELGLSAHEPIRAELADRGIEGLTARRVRHADADTLTFTDGLALPYDVLITTGLSVGSPVWKDWPVDGHGFLKVDPFSRQVQGTPHAYAVGDAANHPVKQACQALFQADVAADDLVSRVTGAPRSLDPHPGGFWILEQLDQALLFQPGYQTGDRRGLYAQVLSVGESRRFDLGQALHRYVDPSNPLYAGLLWKGLKSGLGAMPFLTRADVPSPRFWGDRYGSVRRPA